MKTTIKILGYIAFGFSMLLEIIMGSITVLVPGSDWKVWLFLLVTCLPFVILGLMGIIFFQKKRIMSGIFMILGGITTGFIGLMDVRAGLLIGGFSLAVGFIGAILYIIAAIMCFINKSA